MPVDKPNLPVKIGSRKTKKPCHGCGLHQVHCICHLIPRLDSVTRLTLVIHKNELKRTTNTGQLAVAAIRNSDMKIMGVEGSPFLLEEILLPQYHNLLFYPSDDALELNHELLEQIKKPIPLIVPDGNWRQASKVHYRNKQLHGLQRVKIDVPNEARYFMRKESKPIGMATLEAIAHAFGVIEGESVKNILLNLYQAKLHSTLAGRGIRCRAPSPLT
jgi:DTW domain-containing protein YfiP